MLRHPMVLIATFVWCLILMLPILLCMADDRSQTPVLNHGNKWEEEK